MKLAMTTILAALVAGLAPTATLAQTRAARDTATAYGARLTARGMPANQNQNRVTNRINNRIDNRLSLRIERYRPDSTNNPTAAFQAVPQDDKSRTTPVIAPQTPGADPE